MSSRASSEEGLTVAEAAMRLIRGQFAEALALDVAENGVGKDDADEILGTEADWLKDAHLGVRHRLYDLATRRASASEAERGPTDE